MGNQGIDHFGGALWRVAQVVQSTGRKTCLHQGLGDQGVCFGAGFGSAEDHGVTAHQGVSNGASSQHHGAVPRHDAQDDAHRLTQRHGQRAGFVGWNGFALNLRGQRCGFAEHVGGQVHVETCPQRRCTHFRSHHLDELRRFGFQDIGRFEQQATALAGWGVAPRFERSMCGFGRLFGVCNAGRRSFCDQGVVDGVATLEFRVVFSVDPLVVDEELGFHEVVCLRFLG